MHFMAIHHDDRIIKRAKLYLKHIPRQHRTPPQPELDPLDFKPLIHCSTMTDIARRAGCTHAYKTHYQFYWYRTGPDQYDGRFISMNVCKGCMGGSVPHKWTVCNSRNRPDAREILHLCEYMDMVIPEHWLLTIDRMPPPTWKKKLLFCCF